MIIAIAGASGSGKTTLARAFLPYLPDAVLLSTDSFYKDLSHLSRAERAEVNFDHPEAVDWGTMLEVVNKLRNGECAAVPQYDFSTHTRITETVNAGPAESTILEGIFSLWHPAVRNASDIKVFVDTADAICLERRVERDVAERGRTLESVHLQWQRHTLQMFRQHTSPTRDHADHVVDGTTPPHEQVARILKLVVQ